MSLLISAQQVSSLSHLKSSTLALAARESARLDPFFKRHGYVNVYKSLYLKIIICLERLNVDVQ